MLTETYRPTTWAEVIGQEKAVNMLQTMEQRGTLGGRAYWISGQTGTGKTTIARIIANTLADPYNIQEMDAGAVTVATVRQWTEDQHYRPMGERRGRVYVLNEAHGLRKDVVRALLVYLESLAEWTTVIFTTTADGQLSFEDSKIDSSPLLDRCLGVALAQRGLCKPFAERVRQIAMLEGLDGQPLERYERLAKDCRNSFRAMLQAIEAGMQ